jgi:4-hydroxybenzoate polyprenyltransferase
MVAAHGGELIIASVRRGRRSRWRAYLLLARVSNLPTVWTNVLAGMTAVATAVDPQSFAQTAVAASLFYVGGMFLNDAFDAAIDAASRPERPIPRGDVSRAEVYVAGITLIAAGVVIVSRSAITLALGIALAGAIVFYDSWHKGVAIAPVVMGMCRGLVYCLAAATVGGINRAVLIGAAIILTYVTALTLVAKSAGPNARWRVPLMIAGISVVDAAFIAVLTSSFGLALAAAAAFPLTVLLQRVIPGD